MGMLTNFYLMSRFHRCLPANPQLLLQVSLILLLDVGNIYTKHCGQSTGLLPRHNPPGLLSAGTGGCSRSILRDNAASTQGRVKSIASCLRQKYLHTFVPVMLLSTWKRLEFAFSIGAHYAAFHATLDSMQHDMWVTIQQFDICLSHYAPYSTYHTCHTYGMR